MQALCYTAPKTLTFTDIPEPSLQDHEVLIKIKKVGICGTDLHIYNGGMAELPVPLIMGHEFTGEIAQVGNAVLDLTVGTRVVAEHVIGCGNCIYCKQGKKNLCLTPTVIGLHKPGALAEYIVVPKDLVYALPEDLSYDDGVLIEPLSIAVYAVRKTQVTVGDIVSVVGQGPIGLFVDQVAKAAGGIVFGFDVLDNRLAFSKNNGYVFESINSSYPDFQGYFKQACHADGADVVFEVVGRQETAELALELARPGAQVMVLGVFEHNVSLNMMQIVRKELQIKGSWTCLFAFEPTMQLLRTKKISTESLITHRYSFMDAPQAFADAFNNPQERIKTVIEFE